MRYSHRKNRLMTGIASLMFFVAASLCFGFALQGREGSTLLGFQINEDATTILDFLPFFNTKAETRDLYPINDVQNPMVLVNFPKGHNEDQTTWLDDEKIEQADQILNGEGVSLRSYMADISMDTIHVYSTFYGYGEHLDGYMADRELSYYIGGKGESLDRETESQREDELLRQIIDRLNEDPTFSEKTKAELDTNDDGYIDNMTFVIHGNKNNDYNLLWPHQYSFNTSRGGAYPVVVCDQGDSSLKVKDYMVIISGDETSDVLGSSNRGLFTDYSDIGVIAHEYLHMYGFPDMYHNYKYENDKFVPLSGTEQKGDPLGQWDIMDNTISDHPQNPLYYTNMTYSPWKDQLKEPLRITGSTKNVVLQKLDYSDHSGNMAAMIKVDESISPRSVDEYFMVEYRVREGWDERLPGSGLLVYRINTGANLKNAENAIVRYCTNLDNGRINHCGNMFGPPDEVYIFRPGVKGINDQTASNDYHLLDAALAFEGAWNTLGKTLDEVSAYQPSDSFSDTIYFSDGSNSGIVISNVRETGDTISFDIVLPQSREDHDAPIISDTVTGDGIAGRWTNENAILSVTVNDTGRGLASVEVYTADGELKGEDKQSMKQSFAENDHIKTTEFTFQPMRNGTYRIKATDWAGNVSEVKTIQVEYIDLHAPTATIGEVSRSDRETRIPISFQDEESGIAADSMRYATLAIKEEVVDLNYPHVIENGVITLAGDFQGKVCVSAKDRAGNTLPEPTCWIVSDDKAEPQIAVSSDEQNTGWTKKNRLITVQADDDKEQDTGIQSIEVTSDDGMIEAANAHQLIQSFGAKGGLNETFSFEVKANGTYMITVYDYAGNHSDTQITISNIDNRAPLISDIRIRNDKDLGLFVSGAHSITITAHDEPQGNHSGLKEFRYQLVRDGDSYDQDISSAKWQSAAVDETIQSERDFVGTFYVYALDQAGNQSKIYQQRIERISSEQTGMEEGIHDITHRIAIIGISDPEVSIQSEEYSSEAAAAQLGETFMATHELQAVYCFSLMKHEAPYSLEESVTVRLKVEQEWLENNTLRLISIDENGASEPIETVLGDGYLEFETAQLDPIYAAISDKADQAAGVVRSSGANTGDATAPFAYVAMMLGSCSLVYASMHRRYGKNRHGNA